MRVLGQTSRTIRGRRFAERFSYSFNRLMPRLWVLRQHPQNDRVRHHWHVPPDLGWSVCIRGIGQLTSECLVESHSNSIDVSLVTCSHTGSPTLAG